MRRHACLFLALLLGLAACDAAEEPDPDPRPSEEEEPPEARSTGGLRVGVVLPSAEVAVADEADAAPLDFDAVAGRLGEGVDELRTVVPDGEPFVADVAAHLASDDYDLVCVVGRDAEQIVRDLAARHGGTDFCASPGDPESETPDNVLLLDVATEELGHVVGVALGALGGDRPVALLTAGDRTGGPAFRSGMRIGVGEASLREARGTPDELEADLQDALDAEVAAVALDAGAGVDELLGRAGEVPVLAPSPLLGDDAGALRWAVRWDRVIERVVRWHVEGDEEGSPGRLGLRDEIFDVDQGPQSTGAMREAVATAVEELSTGVREPLDRSEADDEDSGDADADAPPS